MSELSSDVKIAGGIRGFVGCASIPVLFDCAGYCWGLGGIGPGFGTCLGVSKPMTDAQTLNICMPTYGNIMGRTQNYGPVLVEDYITAPNIKG